MSKKAILAELKRLYPDAGPELHFTNPYETLVATMLSAQCTDKQVNKVTPEVFARYPDATAMAACTAEELYPLVKSCGFKSKAGNIVNACRMIVEKHGGQVPSTMEELTALPGVGRKTANVVLGQRIRRARHRGGHPCVPRKQPPGSGGRLHRGGNRAAADESHPQIGLAGCPPLADLPRAAGLQGTASPVRKLHPASPVQGGQGPAGRAEKGQGRGRFRGRLNL